MWLANDSELIYYCKTIFYGHRIWGVSELDLGIWGAQIRQSYFMGLYLAKYDALKSNKKKMPSTPSYLGPKHDGVEHNRICCYRFDLQACAFESTKLPSGIAVNPAHVELPSRQRGLSAAYSALSIYWYTTRRLISWLRTTAMNASGECSL